MNDQNENGASTPNGVEVPLEALSDDALLGVIDDFILREGTDYGWQEATLERKREDVRRMLKSRRARIWFDPTDESITLEALP